MKKLVWLSAIIGFYIFHGANRSLAISLDFAPSSQIVKSGQLAVVDIVVSGLGVGGPSSVGAFDLDVSFDPAILVPTKVVFGFSLGNPDPLAFETLTDFNFLTGVVDLAEVSLLSPSDLDALQAASFTLATLTFAPKTKGTSPLTFSQVIVDDAFGAKLDVTAHSGSITVVPEPSALLLLCFGIAALMRNRFWSS